MSNILLRTAVRTLFHFTSRSRADLQAESSLAKYMELAEKFSETGDRSYLVPRLPGVDEDMREWSYFMILEHNIIVNRAITATIQQLVKGEDLHGMAKLDPKKDVMPSRDPGPEQIEIFKDSVISHLIAVRELNRLRGTKRSMHPVFGLFDAHMWNCMFPFHLNLHLNQARKLLRLTQEQNAIQD